MVGITKKIFKMQNRFYTPEYFKNLSEDILFDREFILKSLSYDGTLLQFLPAYMQSDIELIEIALFKYYSAHISFTHDFFKNLPQEILNDREFIIKSLNSAGSLFQYLSEAMKADRELAKIALENDPEVYEQLPIFLQSDRAFAKIALAHNPDIYQDLLQELKSDLELMIPIIKIHPMLFFDAEDVIKSNRGLVLELIDELGVLALWGLNHSLENDIEIYLKALTQEYEQDSWETICLSDENLFKKELVQEAYNIYGDSVKESTMLELQRDKKVLEAVVSKNGLFLKFLNNGF